MNPNHRSDDEWARRVLSDAVGDVEPSDRLAEIRRRTAGRRRRPGWPVVGGAVLATAATVLVAAVVMWQFGDGSDPAPSPAPPAPTATSPSEGPTAPTPEPTPGPMAVPVYFIGDTPQGPRLYREFRQIDADGPGSALPGALELMMAGPADPDYRTSWSPGDLDTSTSFDGIGNNGYWGVSLLEPDLTERPQGMSKVEARLAVQQLIYTVHAATGEAAHVVVDLGQRRVPLLGIVYPSPREGLPKDPQLEALALASISDPAEGAEVADTLVARGRASSFEATVPWEIRDADGDVVLDGFTTTPGWVDRLYPWRTQIDVSDLEPGEYTLAVQTDDPSGGAEGTGPHTDTRTFVVR